MVAARFACILRKSYVKFHARAAADHAFQVKEGIFVPEVDLGKKGLELGCDVGGVGTGDGGESHIGSHEEVLQSHGEKIGSVNKRVTKRVRNGTDFGLKITKDLQVTGLCNSQLFEGLFN